MRAGADDVAVAVRLEDVGAPHRHDPIGQHARDAAIDDAVAQARRMAFRLVIR